MNFDKFFCRKCGRAILGVAPVHCVCGHVIESPVMPIASAGPGTELSKLIPEFFKSESCGCKEYSAKMDRWGIAGCEERFDEIVSHLVAQAKKHKLTKLLGPVNRIVATKWLTMAIENAKEAKSKRPENGDWFVAVTTAPRKDCTLQACIDSIRAAGWEPTIFAEPDSTQTDAKTFTNEKRLGVWHNWLKSAEKALESSADLILTVQDDSLFHPDSRTYTESILWPAKSAGFVSLYTPKHYSTHHDGSLRDVGVYRIATTSLWGACALVWPRKVLEKVVIDSIAKTWIGVRPKSGDPNVLMKRRLEPWRIANSDTAIGQIANKLKRTMWFIDPSPVSHIAEFSTIGHGGNGGRRNCFRCADHLIPLAKQAPPREPVELEI